MTRSPLALIALLAVAALPASRAAAQTDGGLTVPAGFTLEKIATVSGARELAVAPNGDLFAGTLGNTVYVIPDAQGNAGAPQPFTHVDDRPVAGVTIDGERMYLGAQFGVWELPYRAGDRTARAQPRKIATLRPSGIARDHVTTTVAVAGQTLYASVGASCNNCQPELDATRATVQAMDLDGGGMKPRAIHIRNAIALATDPQTGALWAGVAGQDELPHGHPYEMFDPVTLHAGVADYGWPYCYENHAAALAGHDCAAQTVARVVFPAYETPIGAALYPARPNGAYAFPERFRGGAFVTLHGSWHQPPVPPRIVFVALNGDDPRTPVDWNDPAKQWQQFVGGFQSASGARNARPTGIAVGTDGSLFFADDQAGGIYRVRPTR